MTEVEKKAKAYDEALEKTKEMYDSYEKGLIGKSNFSPSDLEDIFPELAECEDETECEDERIRRELVDFINHYRHNTDLTSEQAEWTKKALAYLERQKENIEKEYVFRPVVGTDITIAAEQAIKRAKEGDHLVLAFNGMYLPVREYSRAKEIVDKYETYLEKQKEQMLFPRPDEKIVDTGEVTSRLKYIDESLKPIANFVIDFAYWNLHKEEWNQPVAVVPLFRVLDALITKGNYYGEA